MENKKISYLTESWCMVTTRVETKTFNYAISDCGRIKRINKYTEDEKLLKGSNLNGYRLLNLRLPDKRTQNIFIHKFVAENFIKKTGEDQTHIIHLDNDKMNNHRSNLKWVTREELTAWHIEKGVYDPDNRKPSSRAKLTETNVRMIKKFIRAGKTKKKIIAKKFNITTAHVRKIERGESWGHITIDD